MKKFTRFILVAAALVSLLSFAVGAAAPYATYTYSSTGFVLGSPEAYVPDQVVDSAYIGLDVAFSDPRDLFVDDNQNVYLVDAGNNRIVVMDRYLKLRFTIDSFINSEGVPDTMSDPSGVFVTDKYIYVCDSLNSRILMFDINGNFHKIVPQPESPLFEGNIAYRPVAIAVDEYNRLFVVSSTTLQGVIVMDDDANFQGFIGAQQVTLSAFQIFWRSVQTEEQRSYSEQFLPIEYNNITIDKDNFLYVTTSGINPSTQQAAITSRSTSGKNAPVKKLNASGADVMRRNGFYPPSGEVMVSEDPTDRITGASVVVDAAVGPEGTWSIVDQNRSKVYTYDKEGNMLFIFGDLGVQTGNVDKISSVVYRGSDILVLDVSKCNITVYRRTEYGDLLIQTLANQNNREYDRAVDDWREILKRNNNYDAAYIGIGKALFRNGEYEEAMEYYKAAYDTDNYSDAFKEVRKGILSTWLIPILVVIIGICLLIGKFFGYAAKINQKAQAKLGRKSLKEEMLYIFHLIFHPFDGFWDLKHERRGSIRSAFLIFLITVLVFCYKAIGTGYIFTSPGSSESTNILMQVLSVALPVILWCVANWCLTTLFDGEGSLKDVIIATCYSLAPLPMLMLPSVLLSNVLVSEEGQICTLLESIGFIWVGLLLFFGMMVTHDYSMFKNIITSIGTLVGMAFIMFVVILFSSLMTKIVSFVSGIIVEINFRM